MPLIRSLAASIAAILCALPAAAQTDAPTQIGQFSGWTAYTMPDGKRAACYALSTPDKADDSVKRAKPNLMVTHRPSEKTYNVVSLDLGLDLTLNGSADVTVGKTDFSFFTKDHSAWSRDADTDKAVVTAMVQGKELVIKAKPAKGKPLADSYDLTGFAAALAAIDKACAYKR